MTLRVPVFTSPRKGGWTQPPHLGPNLLLTTLAVVGAVQAPFVLKFAERVQSRHVVQQTETANLLTNTLGAAPPAQAPFVPVLFDQSRSTLRVQQYESVNLLTTTLGVVAPAGDPLVLSIESQARAKRSVQSPDFQNLLTSTLYEATLAEPFIVSLSQPFVIGRKAQGTDSLNLLTTTLSAPQQNPFIPIDWQNPVIGRKVLQPQIVTPLTALLPIDPTRQIDWPNPTVAKSVQQPQPQTGLLQSTLDFVQEPPPPNQYDWPNPKLRTPITSWYSHQLPTEFLPPTVEPPAIDSAEEGGGGWEPFPGWRDGYDRERARRERERRRARELEEETEQIQETLDRDIAKLLREQESKDRKRDELERLKSLASKLSAEQANQEYGERVAKALERAILQGNYSALEALDRELQRAIEEEEFLLLAVTLILLDD